METDHSMDDFEKVLPISDVMGSVAELQKFRKGADGL